jgi:hypothetical protein
MQTMRISERAGGDGMLHLEIPTGQPDAEYEVVIVLQPRGITNAADAQEALGWPTGYFEKTFGSITDDSFVRPPQGELPKAVTLE